MRIAMIVLRLFYCLPYYLVHLNYLGKHCTTAEAFPFVKKIVTQANRKANVKIEAKGEENLPKEDGFVMFPNHQGMFDLMVFLEKCPRPFSFVAKIELKNVPILKNIFCALHCLLMDRQDLRQSVKVINEMADRVSKGENFLIFAEGTRSRMGNKMNAMKPGSFKCAVKAKAPIVPCALIDSFVPFDGNSIKRVTVRVLYLKPLYYDEYKDMNTQEIAQVVRERIEAAIAEELNK